MSNQYVRCSLGVASLSGLVCKLLDFNANNDTVEYTSDSVSAQTNAVGQYVFTFGESAVIPRQWWRIVVVDGSGNLKGDGYGYFFGVDGELVEGQSDPVRLPAAVGGASTVERESSDTAAITFRFPAAGATITATRRIGSASTGTACAGAVTFLETVDDVHFYSFAYNAADRPSAGGAARYKFTDGTRDVWVNFKSVTAVLDSATSTKIDNILEDTGTTLPAQISGISGGSGTGARTVTITVNDGTTVLQNARVRFTEGANTFTALTNSSGVAVFNLDDATYTVAITKSGYSYSGTTMVVNGTETATYSMTAITTTPPDDPVLCTVTIPIRSQYGSALIGEPVDIRFESFVDGAEADAVVLSPPPALTSNSDGNVIVDLYRLAKYKVIYGDEEYVETIKFTTPDSGSYVVTEA